MPEDHPYPNIASFVIRFIQEQPGPDEQAPANRPPLYRGLIRHVQTDREIAFTSWKDAQAFIQEFVPALLEGNPVEREGRPGQSVQRRLRQKQTKK